MQIGDSDFPGVDWADSPLSVIGSMGAAVKELLECGEGVMYFFDGPYYVKFSFSRPGIPDVTISGICDRYASIDSDEGEVVEAQATVPLCDLVQSYENARRALRDWALQRGENEVLSVISRMSVFG